MTDKAEELIAELHAKLHQLVTADDWLRLLKSSQRFHQYSPNNCLLIYMQRPDATRVAGYKAWAAMGRQVRKGEKGIRILAPMLFHAKGTEDGQDKTVLRGFRVTHVFDIAQTDGDEIEDLPRPQLLQGDQVPQELLQALLGVLVTEGFEMEFPAKWDQGEALGYTDFTNKKVVFRPHLSLVQSTKTLAHEVGHVLIHDGTEYGRGLRPITEVEAESFAYVICSDFGLVTDSYSLPYVAGWSGGDMKLIVSTAERVIHAVRLVTGSIEEVIREDAAVASQAWQEFAATGTD